VHPLLDIFERTVERSGDRLAAGDANLTLDYASFRAVAAGLAPRVAALSERPHVGILAPTSTAGAVAIFACWYAGKTPVPLNFLLGPAELGKIIRDADLDAALTVAPFEPALKSVGIRTLLLDAETLRAGAGAAVVARSATPVPPRQPHDLAVILYTSGTAGDPKGVCLSFENIVRNVQASIEHARLTPDQVLLSVLPQFHSFGFTAKIVLPLLLGATVWFQPRFSPLAVVQTIAEKRVNVFMAVASMYAAIAKLKHADPGAFCSLGLAISGGEALPMSVALAFKERFGVDLMEGYGLTETSPVVSINVPWAHRLGSVGRPIPGVEVYAVDAGGGRLPADAEGELLIRGHCVMQGYHNKPQATAAVLRDGALHTGDLGRVDPDGFLYITGRAKDLIIVGGENVAPREIEEVLLSHPAVAEAVVVGVRDEVRGEVPVAYVILKDGAAAMDAAGATAGDRASATRATESELRSFCRERLAGYKAPREVHIVRDLPRGPTGKVLKRELSSRS